MSSKTVWRIAPTPWLADAVHKLALKENRSTSNMLFQLVDRAVRATTSAEKQKPEIQKLIEIIRGQETTP
jgi:hypothetical protein